jgi:hypothetical protein
MIDDLGDEPETRQRLFDAAQAREDARQERRRRSPFWRLVALLAGTRPPPPAVRTKDEVLEIARRAAGIGEGPQWSAHYPMAASLEWESDRVVWRVVTGAWGTRGGLSRLRIDDRTGEVLSLVAPGAVPVKRG